MADRDCSCVTTTTPVALACAPNHGTLPKKIPYLSKKLGLQGHEFKLQTLPTVREKEVRL